jgi:hypothetical protein
MRGKKFGSSLVLLNLFAISIPTTHASLITPDSIPLPPASVNSAGGTPVPTANLVTTQYTGLGLNFSNAAITRLNGVKVWAPVEAIAVPASEAAGQPPPIYIAPLGYTSWAGGGNFVVPGTTKATSVYSMSLEIMGNGFRAVQVYNSRWQMLGFAMPEGMGPHGGELYAYSGGNIGAFSVVVPTMDPPDTYYPPWGVAQVSYVSTPEPSGLVLAGLGTLGIVLTGLRRAARNGIALRKCRWNRRQCGNGVGK